MAHAKVVVRRRRVLYNASALVIERVTRGHRDRKIAKVFRHVTCSASSIQRAYRCHLARSIVRKLRHRRDLLEANRDKTPLALVTARSRHQRRSAARAQKFVSKMHKLADECEAKAEYEQWQARRKNLQGRGETERDKRWEEQLRKARHKRRWRERLGGGLYDLIF